MDASEVDWILGTAVGSGVGVIVGTGVGVGVGVGTGVGVGASGNTGNASIIGTRYWGSHPWKIYPYQAFAILSFGAGIPV